MNARVPESNEVEAQSTPAGTEVTPEVNAAVEHLRALVSATGEDLHRIIERFGGSVPEAVAQAAVSILIYQSKVGGSE